MKLRIKGNTLRLRLTQPEVDQLRDTGRVSEVVRFAPGQRMTYMLEATRGVDQLRATYDGEHVVVRVPHEWTTDWPTSDRVGFEGEQAIEPGVTLSLLVEKDFQCLHKEDDNRDPHAYPHPAEASHTD